MSKWAREEYMLLAQPTELSLWKAVRWKQSFAFNFAFNLIVFVIIFLFREQWKVRFIWCRQRFRRSKRNGQDRDDRRFQDPDILGFPARIICRIAGSSNFRAAAAACWNCHISFQPWVPVDGTLGSSPNYIITLLKLFAWLTDLSAPFVCGTWNGAQVGQVSACVRCMFRIKTLCPPVFCMFMTLKLFCALRFLFDLANNILWY